MEQCEQQFRAITDQIASQPTAPGKWSRKQMLGHLIDSASNNHQRFVRLQLAPSIEGHGYEQEGWVRVQHYAERPWAELVALWAAYNRHLAHVIDHIPAAALAHTWKRDSAASTLEYLVEDYNVHLKHHLKQIL